MSNAEMRAEKVIGVIGASGAVGRCVCEQLYRLGVGSLKIGCRNTQRLRGLLSELLIEQSTLVNVDVYDPNSLKGFCLGTDIIINCAGPAYLIQDLVARAAISSGAHYVDPCGSPHLYNKLATLPLNEISRTCVISAGFIPGISEYLARLLFAGEAKPGYHLQIFVGGLSEFSSAGATDYILSQQTAEGYAFSKWKNGVCFLDSLETLSNIDLPYFPRRVSAIPYLSAEMARLAQSFQLGELSYHAVFDGQHLLSALNRCRSLENEGPSKETVKEICKASKLDLVGKQPYQIYLCQLEGDGETRSIYLYGKDVSSLTAAFSVLVTQHIIANRETSGLHYAAELLDTDASLASLCQTLENGQLRIIESSMMDVFEAEEGVI